MTFLATFVTFAIEAGELLVIGGGLWFVFVNPWGER